MPCRPDILAENSVVNGLFHFHSKCHDDGTQFSLLHANDVTYCKKWQPRKTRLLKCYAEDYKPSRTREWNSKGMPRLLPMGGVLFLSLPTGNVKFLSFEYASKNNGMNFIAK